ncbi:ARM repeat superfamily protein isoform X2 [Wolffia australiana]
MMAFMAAIEADLRSLSAEARRRHPALKDAAEHAILKLRSSSGAKEIAQNDLVRIFLMACEVKSVKLSVIGLSCIQKLLSNDAVLSSSLGDVVSMLKNHAEIADEVVQLKTLQTVLMIFQSHLYHENEENLSKALGICLRLLENTRSSDSVHNTAAATFRQAVALTFDNVTATELHLIEKGGHPNQPSQSSTPIDDVRRHPRFCIYRSPENVHNPDLSEASAENLSKSGKLGVCLLEDLTALASGGSAVWLPVHSLQRTFSLDIVDFILSNYVAVFRSLVLYEQVLRHQICSLLMNSLRTNVELEGEAGEPAFRRLVLKTVAHVIKLYSSSLVTECEVFLNVLVKATALDISLWHRILVLEVLRGFCVDASTLRILYQTFDMDPRNTNVVENMANAFARVVSSVQVHDSADESLAAVAGMFSSKAKGIEWSLENDASNATVVVASEAHAITLAIEGLLGVVFTIATLTDEAVEAGELESPKCTTSLPREPAGITTILCLAMVESMWLIILDSLSLILTRSHGEAIMLEILKGYQAFTQACGVLHAVEPLNSFLASLCKFTICVPGEAEKKSSQPSSASKKSELLVDQKEGIVLTPKNVQALRTLFNVSHRLHNILGASWVLVLETVATLDRAIHSPHASTQEVSASVPRLTRETSGQYTDFSILSSLDSKLFESSALMDVAAVKSLLSALHMLSNQSISVSSGGLGQSSSLQLSNISFSVERTILILENNLHRVESLWDQVVSHFLELNKNPSLHVRSVALDALDRSVCSVLASDKFQNAELNFRQCGTMIEDEDLASSMFERSVLSPIRYLYTSSQALDVRSGCLKILLHVLERHAEKLYFSWTEILEMLRSVASASEKDLIPLGFQSVRVIMNDELSTIPIQYLDTCIEVTGSYGEQQADLNISLTAIGLLWTSSDFIAKGLRDKTIGDMDTGGIRNVTYDTMSDKLENIQDESERKPTGESRGDNSSLSSVHSNKLLLSVFSIFRKLGADERPEVRNAVIRTLFQTLGSYGQKLSRKMWEDCLWTYVFPILDDVNHLATTSSRDEWQGKELGTRRGKAVHMLIHHSRNTAQKQWDETLVLVLSGITRLLRSFFPFLQTLDNFSGAWERLLHFVKDSISNGSKEVAFAAISCLQTTVMSNCAKGNISVSQLKSILDVYELVLQRSPSYTSTAAHKVTQEILTGLGSLFVEARLMFNNDMYAQLLVILQLAIRRSVVPSESIDAEFGNVQSMYRTIFEVIPMLCPEDHLSSMWPQLLEKLLTFLPGSWSSLGDEKDETNSTAKIHDSEGLRDDSSNAQRNALSDVDLIVPNQVARNSLSPKDAAACGSANVFGEKLIPVVVEMFIRAPETEREITLPEFLHCLGRCMSTRRDNPSGRLWRLAAEGFNHVMVDVVTRGKSDEIEKKNLILRSRLWKEVADIYDTFLVGSCGRVIASGALSAETLSADESLEIAILNNLGDLVLKAQLDSPFDNLERLVSVLDRCASRTGSLPLETVSLLPPRCSRFSLSCLLKLFSLASYALEDSWHTTRIEVSRISIRFLMNRSNIILNQYLRDENDLGESTLPTVRTKELVHVLKELARMIVHPDVESVLSIPEHLKENKSNEKGVGRRSHLLLLFPSFCELVSSRESRVRELVQVLLRLVVSELGLEKLGLTCF